MQFYCSDARFGFKGTLNVMKRRVFATLGTISLVWGIIATVLVILGVIGFFIIIAIAAANGDVTTTSDFSY